MATIISNLRLSRLGFLNISQVPAIRTSLPIRENSNAASVTKIKRTCFAKMYPTLLVFPDGSTANIRYKEPRKIIKLPLDFSKLSEAQKKIVLANRKPKQKLEVIEDFGNTVDLNEYSKFFKK